MVAGRTTMADFALSAAGAAYACMVAAFDPRVRAFASVAGVLDFRGAVEAMLGAEAATEYVAEVGRRAEGKRPEASFVPVAGTNPSFVMLPGEAAYRFFDRVGHTLASRWRNRISIQLLTRPLDFHALPFLPRLAQRPALFVQGNRDALCPVAAALRLLEPGAETWTIEWVWTRHHFELYEASDASREAASIVGRWLKPILMPRRASRRHRSDRLGPIASS